MRHVTALKKKVGLILGKARNESINRLNNIYRQTRAESATTVMLTRILWRSAVPVPQLRHNRRYHIGRGHWLKQMTSALTQWKLHVTGIACQ
jgi:hypothetical protein